MTILQKLSNIVWGKKTTPETIQRFEHSTVFCIAPWIQLHAQNLGDITPCCMSAYQGETIGSLRTDSNLRNAWNSPKMKQLRLNMLEGRESAMCKNCYSDQQLGKWSDRMQYNHDYTHYFDRVYNTLPDGTVLETDIPLLDIRFSNKCNYKCRICNSSNSTQLYEEELRLGRILPSQNKLEKPATNETAFWDSYLSLLPGVKRLHFAGGEPLMMDEHYKALEHLVRIGHTNVTLSYNTNLSNLRYKRYNIVDLWNQFEKVDVWAILDGMAAVGDYQRKGQDWHTIESNIRYLQTHASTVLFGIDITVSILNIFHIPLFYQYLVEHKFVTPDRVNLYFLRGPEYFCVTNLTPGLKTKAVKVYNQFVDSYLAHTKGAEKMKASAMALIAFMQSEQLYKQAEFKQRITETDQLRNETFLTIFPELVEFFVDN